MPNGQPQFLESAMVADLRIYFDFEPDTVFMINSNVVVFDVDVDLDGDTDVSFSKFSPSTGDCFFIYQSNGGWEIGFMRDPACDTISNFNAWTTSAWIGVGLFLPDWDEYYPCRFVVRHPSEEGYYYGWLNVWIMGHHEQGWSSATCYVRIDDMAVCTKTDYPLVFGQFDFWSTEELYAEKKLAKVYPNPVRDVFAVKAPQGNECERVELYDLQGRLVFEQNSNFEGVSVAELSSGVYFARVVMRDGKFFNQKIIKE